MTGFFSGSLDPFLPHVVLLALAIVASFAVAAGIVLENPKWSIANVLVVGGVAVEAACTLLLFGFDEGISRNLQAQVVTATDRATDAQEQLAEYLLPRFLDKEREERLAAVAKSFPSLTFRTAAVPQDEPWGFAMNIGSQLQEGGWTWAPCANENGYALTPLPPDPRPSSCSTIVSHIQINAPSFLENVATSLRNALLDENVIGMDRIVVVTKPTITTLTIIVGSKR